MTNPKLAMSPFGEEWVEELRRARTPEQRAEARTRLHRLACDRMCAGEMLTHGDWYAISIESARHAPPSELKTRASLLSAAGHSAEIAGALEEALACFEQAQACRPQRRRAAKIDELRANLERARLVTERTRPRARKRAS